MGNFLIIVAVFIILILIFIFLTFSIFWGVVVFFAVAVFSFFSSFFDENSEQYEIIQPDPSAIVICIDSQKHSHKLIGEDFIIKYNRSDGSKYIVTDNGSKYDIKDCFSFEQQNYF